MPLASKFEINSGYDGNNDHHQDRNRLGIPELVIYKSAVINLMHNGSRRIYRTSVCKDLHLLKYIKIIDKAGYQKKKGGRTQHRKGDISKSVQRIYPVNFGGFIKMLGYAQQAGSVNDHIVSQKLPE